MKEKMREIDTKVATFLCPQRRESISEERGMHKEFPKKNTSLRFTFFNKSGTHKKNNIMHVLRLKKDLVGKKNFNSLIKKT